MWDHNKCLQSCGIYFAFPKIVLTSTILYNKIFFSQISMYKNMEAGLFYNLKNLNHRLLF
jgi:hypothetical protein